MVITRKRLRSFTTLLILMLALLVVFFPYFWTLLASFKDAAAINHPLSFNFVPTLDNWKAVVQGDIPHQALNSLLVGLLTVSISLVAGSMAATVSRFNWGANPAVLVLLAEMLPQSVLIVPCSALYTRSRCSDRLGGGYLSPHLHHAAGHLVPDRLLR